MEATEVVRFSDARASLWTGVTLKGDSSPDSVADHMVVEPDIGTTDDVLVLNHEGQRKVLRLQQVMQLEGTDPALPVSVSWGHKADAVTPEETQRLLAIYDHFDKRSYR